MSERQEGPERISLLPDDGWSWCEGVPPHEEDRVEYVRADLYTTLLSEKQALEAERARWRKCCEATTISRDEYRDMAISAEAERGRLAQEVERDDFGDLVTEARAEAEKAMKKFPQPNYVISKIAEEAGEVVKAAIHCAERRETADNLRGEMKQVIAMLYRLWVEGDGVHGLPAVRTALRTETGGE